jgi:alpha-tubulin suppressor-like RCC1 family protein
MNLELSFSSQAEHAIFIRDDGDLYSWGNSAEGSVGVGPLENICTPQLLALPDNSPVKLLACGQHHTLALSVNENLYAWGKNTYGQAGQVRGDLTIRTPILIKEKFPHPILKLVCGSHFSGILTKDGSFYMVGDNDYGQLGQADLHSRDSPTLVPDLPPLVDVSLGWYHSVGLTRDGKLYVWGRNNSGELGLPSGGPSENPEPALLPLERRVIKIACGAYHSMILTEDDELYVFGWNFYGNLGINNFTNSHEMLLLQKGGIRDFAAGWCHSMLLLEDDTLQVFGYNAYGQLGLGICEHKGERCTLDFDGGKIVGIGCLCDTTYVITQGGNLWIWGRGEYGINGMDDFLDKSKPYLFPHFKVMEPKDPRGFWRQVGVWLWQGRFAEDSELANLPVEIVYNFVHLFFTS